ncbi:MAG: hypothetical protein JSV58_07125 [Candidatus Bathyarchaeota archaeon]|nr:MAG: hypothetical protein JSV58_07125 [Candidatus Bathyarchaeota archaeon]
MNKGKKAVLTSLLAVVMLSVFISVGYCEIGTGILFVYEDTWGGVEAQKAGPQGTYEVIRGLTYYIRLVGITEFGVGELLTIKIGWTDINWTSRTTFFFDVPVLEMPNGTRYVDVPAWDVPRDGKVCTTCTVHYTMEGFPDYVAQGQASTTGHMHIIPETLFGTLSMVLTCFAGLGIAFKRKKLP